MSDTTVLHISFKRNAPRESVIKDAQNDDEWDEQQLHEVVLDWGEITVEGTPEGIRWLYDWLEWAEDAHRLEDGMMEADACREMADAIWEVLSPNAPPQQRNRRML